MDSLATKIFLMFLCINISLSMGFSSVGEYPITPGSDIDLMNKSYGVSKTSSDSSTVQSYVDMLKTVIGFITGEGISHMLIASGAPREIQIIIGLPMLVLAYLALAPLLASAAGTVLNLVGRFV